MKGGVGCFGSPIDRLIGRQIGGGLDAGEQLGAAARTGTAAGDQGLDSSVTRVVERRPGGSVAYLHVGAQASSLSCDARQSRS